MNRISYKKALVLLLVVVLSTGILAPYNDTYAAPKVVVKSMFDDDIMVNTFYKYTDIINSFTVNGKTSGFDVSVNFSSLKGNIETVLEGYIPKVRVKKVGKYLVPVTITAKSSGQVIAKRNYTLIVVDDPVQKEIDHFLRMIYFASHPDAEVYDDPEVVGYFSVENKACTKHTSSNNACSACGTLEIIRTAWFKAVYPLQAQTPSGKLAGVGRSCFAFTFTLIDCLLRTNTSQDIHSRGNRVSGYLNKSFCDKYVQPGDALCLGGHYCVVYDYDKATGLITICESNRNSKDHSSVYKKTYTLSGKGAYPYAGKYIERRRYVAS